MRKILIGLFISVLILTGCSDRSPEEKSPTKAVASLTPTLIPASVAIWYSDPQLQTALTQLVADFETASPQVDVTLTLQEESAFRDVIAQGLAEGGGPDLIVAGSRLLPDLVKDGDVIALDSVQLRPLELFIDRDALKAGTWEGKLYGFPLLTFAPLIFVDSQKTTTAITSFETFLAGAQAGGAVIQTDFLTTGGWANLENFYNPYNVVGEPILGAATFTEYLGRVAQLRVLEGVTFSDDPTPFVAGDAAFYVGSSRQLPLLRSAVGDGLMVQALHPTEGGNGYIFVDASLMMLSLNATDTSIAAAHSLITFLMQPDQQRKLSQISGYAPMLAAFTDDALLQAAADAADQGFVLPADSTFYDGTLPRLNTAIAQVLSGVLGPDEAGTGVFSVP